MSRSERIAKYNRLLEIEMEVGRVHAVFLGLQAFRNITLPFEKEPERVLIGSEEIEEKVDIASLSLVDKSKRKKRTKKVVKAKLDSEQPVEVESVYKDQSVDQNLASFDNQESSSVTDDDLSSLTESLIPKRKKTKKSKTKTSAKPQKSGAKKSTPKLKDQVKKPAKKPKVSTRKTQKSKTRSKKQ